MYYKGFLWGKERKGSQRIIIRLFCMFVARILLVRGV